MSCDIFNQPTVTVTRLGEPDENQRGDWSDVPRFESLRGGTKHDDGKARYDLFPWELMDGVIAVYTHGAREYSDNNWRKGFKWGRIIGAVFRHFVGWLTGNDLDPKTGLHNLDQAVWNLLCLRYMQKEAKGVDDRWK